MDQRTKQAECPRLDTKEFELPETLFVRDIENRVFQSIVLQCLAEIDGIGLVEGSFLDSLLGRSGVESVKGIVAQQDNQSHAVNIRVEVNVRYGVSIPDKAQEIQSRISEEVTRLTGLHVSQVHVVFRNLIHSDSTRKLMKQKDAIVTPVVGADGHEEEYCDDF